MWCNIELTCSFCVVSFDQFTVRMFWNIFSSVTDLDIFSLFFVYYILSVLVVCQRFGFSLNKINYAFYFSYQLVILSNLSILLYYYAICSLCLLLDHWPEICCIILDFIVRACLGYEKNRVGNRFKKVNSLHPVCFLSSITKCSLFSWILCEG